jgi:hypothetical protein
MISSPSAANAFRGRFTGSLPRCRFLLNHLTNGGEVYRRILDKQAGFELLCSDVVIARGAKSVPRDPFSGFLGEK